MRAYPTCPVCGKDLSELKPERQRDHIVLHFKQELTRMVKTRVNSQFKCPECSFLSPNQERVAFHLGTQHPERLEKLIEKYQIQQQLQPRGTDSF